MKQPTFLDIAHPLAQRGWYVFPVHFPVNGVCTCWKRDRCAHPAKHPIHSGWQDEATTKIEVLAQLATEYPRANVGLACGPSQLVVLDVDPRHEGDLSLRTLEHRYSPLPVTPCVLTGGGGQQFYFQAPEVPIPNATTLAGWSGLDLRSDGGLVVGVGSLHVSGRRYEWEVCAHPEDVPLAPMPAWLIELAQQSAKKKAAAVLGLEIKVGERNTTLFSLAGSMRRRGLSERAICAALMITNEESCKPLLSQEEVRAIASSVSRYNPAAVPDAPTMIKQARLADPMATRQVNPEEVSACLRA